MHLTSMGDDMFIVLFVIAAIGYVTAAVSWQAAKKALKLAWDREARENMSTARSAYDEVGDFRYGACVAVTFANAFLFSGVIMQVTSTGGWAFAALITALALGIMLVTLRIGSVWVRHCNKRDRVMSDN